MTMNCALQRFLFTCTAIAAAALLLAGCAGIPAPEEISSMQAEAFITAEPESGFTITPQRTSYTVKWTVTNHSGVPVKLTYRTCLFQAENDRSITTGETRGTGIHTVLEPASSETVQVKIYNLDDMFFQRLRSAGGEPGEGLIYLENIYFTVEGIGKRLTVSTPVEVAPRPGTD
jgi:hypothetical protein